MPTTLKVLGAHRPMVESARSSGNHTDFVAAPGLVVAVDRYGDGLVHLALYLEFADYAGLETEWSGGTATTVLRAAVTAAVEALDVPEGAVTTGQRDVAGDTLTIGD